MLKNFFAHLFKPSSEIELLEKRNQCLQDLFLAYHYTLWEWDFTQQTMTWLYHKPMLLGYELKKISPSSVNWWQQKIHPDDLQEVLQSLQNILKENKNSLWNISYRFQCQDGHYVTLKSIAKICYQQQTPIGLMACIEDVTASIETDKLLHLNQQVLSSLTNGIVIVDTLQHDSPITYVNTAFTQMTGYTAQEVTGKNCRFLQGNDREQPELTHLRDAIARGKKITTTLRNYRKDGSLFWNELHLAPVKNDQGLITHYVGILHDVTERKLMENLLLQQATHDALTGLPNRSLLIERLNKEIDSFSMKQEQFAIFFMDLDGFKVINDKFDHSFGDLLLKNVTERLERILRAKDIICRIGGDEFIMFCSNISKREDAEQIAERILNLFHQDFLIQDKNIHITISIGIGIYPYDGEDTETIIKHADAAMYLAKKNGRNRYEFYVE